MAIIKMTREEYEKKYGAKPPTLGSTTDMTSNSSETQTSQAPQESKRTVPEKIAGFFGMEKFAKGIGQAAFSLTKEKKELDKLLEEGKIDPKTYEEITTGGLTNREVLGSALSTATMFAPVAGKTASLGAKIATGATTGYGMDVGSKLQQENKTVGESFKPGLGTVVGGVIPLLGGIFGKGINAKRLEEINMRMTPLEKQRLATKGKDVVGYVTEKKLTGTPEVRYNKITQLWENMENKVAGLIKSSGVKYNKQDILNAIKQVPEEFGDDIAGYDEAERTAERLAKFIENKAPDEISGTLLNKYKRALFKRAYSKNNTDVVNESYHAAAEKFKTILDNDVKPLQKLNEEYGKIIMAKKILFKATTRPQQTLTGKLLGAGLGAGVGGAIGGGVGAGFGAVVGERASEKLLGTAVRSNLGAGMQTIAEKLPKNQTIFDTQKIVNEISKIPIDQSGNLKIGRKALISLLQQLFAR